ncbi:MAG: cadherin-like domain-containing protein, partial [Bacteroidales bacterium]|nr:cadherin-like domain-containing protein [Bacteroidales bacterium]
IFTPDDTYACAVPYSVTISVEPRIKLTFDPVAPLCIGDIPPPLPVPVNPGITGKWNPAAIDTNTPGNKTYTFTPDDNGVCAEPYILTVEVVDKVPPKAEDRKLTAQINMPVMGNISGYVKYPSPAPIRVTITEKPVFGDVTIDENTGKFTYTPKKDYTGVDELTYEFCYDSGPCGWLCDEAKVTINVKLPNRPPVAEDSYFTVVCVPLYEYFSASDPDGDKLRFNPFFVDSPRHGIAMVLGDNDGYFSYEPDLEFVGEDSLTFRVCDTGGLCDEATVYFKVLPRVDCDGLPGGEDQPDTECSLFIPEGFSPNGDGVHDFFQVYCIEKYPDAILRVFDRSGSKIFQKHHYGNLDYWGTDENAWWWGTAESRWVISRGTLPAGTYLYVLELGNGEVRTGTVMIAY